MSSPPPPNAYWNTTPKGVAANLYKPRTPNALLCKLHATSWYTYVYIIVTLLLAALVGYALYRS